MVDDWMHRHDLGPETSNSQDMTNDAEPGVRAEFDTSQARKSGESKQQDEQEERPDDEEDLCDNDWSTISARPSFHLPAVPDGMLDLNFEMDAELGSSPEVARNVALPA
ncbi:hypothetical protein CERZMDRAFT_94345 [Cercospora zeae-maydis SCOH1-5]|uniref:Uncharacterized protein n=1 Tax=Cercospora zeae-maydis SCOH1-5 TaxID=717836 RepID=A0A6A6FRE3_9PEZI|nr:hypothetical protein CERZMDRAFT_94345 [Cercospora zeae-maydis SCOH1-5]